MAATRRATLVIMFLMAGTSGCAALDLPNWNSDEYTTASPANPVTEVLCIWQPAEGSGLKGLPARGFAGRLMFFARNGSVPIRVEGDVRILLFDDRGPDDSRTKPIHQFEFEGEAWNTHLVAGQFGPTYQIFLPYPRRDHYETLCALQVRLQPSYGGKAVHSELVSLSLPGTARSGKDEARQAAQQPDAGDSPTDLIDAFKKSSHGVMPAAHSESSAETSQPETGKYQIERTQRPAAAVTAQSLGPVSSLQALQDLLSDSHPLGNSDGNAARAAIGHHGKGFRLSPAEKETLDDTSNEAIDTDAPAEKKTHPLVDEENDASKSPPSEQTEAGLKSKSSDAPQISGHPLSSRAITPSSQLAAASRVGGHPLLERQRPSTAAGAATTRPTPWDAMPVRQFQSFSIPLSAAGK